MISDQRLLDTFERFLALPTGSLELTLSGAADLVAGLLDADKVDAFLHDPTRNSLVALGTSRQPLSALQRKQGLDVVPVSDGGLSALVFTSREPLLSGDVGSDMRELRGVREVLGVQSLIAVPLEVGGTVRGVLNVTSREPGKWSAEGLRLTVLVARWVGLVAHRAQLVAELERRALEQGRIAVADELVTVVAHDLRNYLAPLELRLRLLRRNAERDSRAGDLHELDRGLRTVARLGSFVTDLLDVARIDHGLFELDSHPVQLVTLAEDVASMLSSETRPVQVEAAEEVVVSADVLRIRQCLDNLVANAVKHAPEGAAVTVVVAREERASGPWARIDIIDEGPGVPQHLIPNIFERFVGGEKTREAGLGLGLFLAKRIALMHRGDLTLESKPGLGTRFTLTLPCLPTLD